LETRNGRVKRTRVKRVGPNISEENAISRKTGHKERVTGNWIERGNKERLPEICPYTPQKSTGYHRST